MENVVHDAKSGVYRCGICGRAVSIKPGNNYCPKCGTKFISKNKNNLTYMDDGEQCPKCEEYESIVVDKRFRPKYGLVVRKRKCKNCGEIWMTTEVHLKI